MALTRAATLFAAVLAAAVPRTDSPTGYRKPYFGATKPGTWAKFRMTALGAPDGFTTYTRLPDARGQQRLQVRTDLTVEGKKRTTYTDCTLEQGYSLQKDALGFGKAAESVSVWEEGMPAEDLDDDDLEDMRTAAPDFAPTATFVAEETVLGRTCDRYKYRQRHPGDPDQIETGDIWLNEAVPFGLVRQAGVARDASGRFLSRFEMTLVDSGAGAAAASSARARQTVAGAPVRLADAYADARVELAVEVLSEPGDGSRLEVRFKNKSGDALRLAIPSGPTELEIGGPVETLRVESASTWLFDLEPGETSAPVELSQTGASRAASGKFVASISDGKPLFSGDVTMGRAR